MGHLNKQHTSQWCHLCFGGSNTFVTGLCICLDQGYVKQPLRLTLMTDRMYCTRHWKHSIIETNCAMAERIFTASRNGTILPCGCKCIHFMCLRVSGLGIVSTSVLLCIHPAQQDVCLHPAGSGQHTLHAPFIPEVVHTAVMAEKFFATSKDKAVTTFHRKRTLLFLW